MTKTADDFSDLMIHMAAYRRLHPGQREGQAYFNALSEKYPDLASLVSLSFADPFYKDSRIPAFFEFVGEYFG